jgi:hypothetical protein
MFMVLQPCDMLLAYCSLMLSLSLANTSSLLTCALARPHYLVQLTVKGELVVLISTNAIWGIYGC